MKRYAFFPRIGSGTSENEFRPSVADLSNITYKIVSKVDEFGIELKNYYLTRCAKADFGAVFLLSNSYIFPDATLDTLLSAIGNDPNNSNDILSAMNQACVARQLITPWMSTPSKPWNEWSFGDVILNIAQQIDPLWPNLNNFDVSEPS
jgi:hypothetical protein